MCRVKRASFYCHGVRTANELWLCQQVGKLRFLSMPLLSSHLSTTRSSHPSSLRPSNMVATYRTHVSRHYPPLLLSLPPYVCPPAPLPPRSLASRQYHAVSRPC